MTGIFETALGDDFARLHPMMRRRFGVGLEAGYACVGTGVMTRIRRGPWWTVPFLWIGRIRNILVPIQGTDVPFTVENFPYRDPFGRETVTFVRTYGAGAHPHRFDATMIYSQRAGRVIDYLGTHQHLAVDLDLEVGDDGSLLLRSNAQRFYEGPLAFRFPMLFSGRAELRESFDDAAGVYRINLEVTNDRFGFLFGYEGTFSCTFLEAGTAPEAGTALEAGTAPAAVDAPARLRPRRHERRE